jgi:hypothetical protein
MVFNVQYTHFFVILIKFESFRSFFLYNMLCAKNSLIDCVKLLKFELPLLE